MSPLSRIHGAAFYYHWMVMSSTCSKQNNTMSSSSPPVTCCHFIGFAARCWQQFFLSYLYRRCRIKIKVDLGLRSFVVCFCNNYDLYTRFAAKNKMKMLISSKQQQLIILPVSWYAPRRKLSVNELPEAVGQKQTLIKCITCRCKSSTSHRRRWSLADEPLASTNGDERLAMIDRLACRVIGYSCVTSSSSQWSQRWGAACEQQGCVYHPHPLLDGPN